MSQIVYHVHPLNSLEEICGFCNVGKRMVKIWAAQGAPIGVSGNGSTTTYCSEGVALQTWRMSQTRQQMDEDQEIEG